MHSTRIHTSALTLAVLSTSALAARTDVTTVFTVAIKEGDAVGAIGNLTSIDGISINDDGDWLVEGDTNHATTTADYVVLLNGAVVAREGDALAAPSGATISSFGSGGTALNSNGNRAWNYFLDGLTTSTDSGIYFDNTLVIQESAISTAPQFSANTPYIGFFGARLNDANQVAIMASIDDVAITSTVDRAIVLCAIDGGGNLLSETVVAKEGDLLAGQTAGNVVADFGTTLHSWDLNDGGQVLYVADLAGATTSDGVVYLGSTLIAQEGSPSPIGGRNWLTLSTSMRVALNDAGDYAFTGTLDGDTATDAVIALNNTVYAQEGSVPPDITGFTLTGFGTGAVDLDDAGNIYWLGDWNDPDTTKDVGLFRNDQLLVQEGVTVIAGQPLFSIATVQENFRVSPDGQWLIFEGELTSGVSAAILIEMSTGVTTYCTAGTTTNGCNAAISGIGTPSASGATDFDVVIANVEGQKQGIVFYGVSGTNNAPWGASSSFLCVKSPTQRTGTQSSGGTAGLCDGAFALDVDAYLAANPTALGAPFSSGDTAWFQGWYRDPPSPKTTHLSDALEVVFGP